MIKDPIKADKNFAFHNEDEIRDGFRVTGERKQIWAVQLALLKKLLEVCKEHHIKCFIIWGTLLGAVRHKGFIPWDDDLDVAMFRDDYEKLCSVAGTAFEEPYFFQTAYTDREFFFSYARLRNTNTTCIIRDFYSADYHQGIFIDIYPLDGIRPPGLAYCIQRIGIDLMAAIARTKTGHRKKGAKTALLNLISIAFSYEKACDLHLFYCKKYNKSADRVGLIYHRNLMKSYQFHKQDAEKIIMIPFEDIMVPAPCNYERILSDVYGDYMRFPPPEKRGNWHSDQLIYDADTPYREYIESHMILKK